MTKCMEYARQKPYDLVWSASFDQLRGPAMGPIHAF